MQPLKPHFTVPLLLVAAASVGFGQIVLNFGSNRVYRQSRAAVDFRKPGGMFVHLSDGSWVVTGCPLNGMLDNDPAAFFPNPLIGCQTGSTGYIVAGDVGGAVDDEGNQVPDGVRDEFSHWEVTSVSPAVGIAPSRPDKCFLFSRPPSSLPNMLGNFIDNTVVIYWNTRSESIKQYTFSRYDFTRSYDTRNQMDQELVVGQYVFRFPRLGAPDTQVADLKVDLRPIAEGYIEKNNVRQGLRFTKLNGKPIQWSPDGFVLVDPRLVNTFEWLGNDQSNVFVSNDVLYFSVTSLGPGPGDPTRPEQVVNGQLVKLFPFDFDPASPGTPRVLLDHALVQSFAMPPGFIRVANPPIEGVARLELFRNTPSTYVTFDTSSRIYQLPLRFVDTYEGWATVSFPSGTPAALRARTADPDRDNFNNEAEWRAKTNPMSAASHPSPPLLQFVSTNPVDAAEAGETGGATSPQRNSVSGYWEVRHPMANTYPPTHYEFEFSADLRMWNPVSSDDMNWTIIRETPVDGSDRDPDLIVRSRSPQLSEKGFFRVKMTTQPDTSVPTALPVQ